MPLHKGPLLKIYVAGASKEIYRAKHWIRRVNTLYGAYITLDWTKDMEPRMSAGQGDDTLETNARFKLASLDVVGVEEADLVWCLIPAKAASAGLWFELGYAIAKRKMVLSSGSWERSIFTELGDWRYDEDEDAFNEIQNLLQNRMLLLEGKNDTKNGTNGTGGNGSTEH